MKASLPFIILLHSALLLFSQQSVKDKNGYDIIDKTFIVKFQPSGLKSTIVAEPTTIITDDFYSYLDDIDTSSFVQLYPDATIKNCAGCVDITTIYKVEYDANIAVDKVIDYIQSLPGVVYAEALPVQKLMYTPDDPLLYQQYYLDTIKAYDAWDITKGDSNIVIGIVDSEFDLNHEDLIDQVFYNYDDEIDGIDNDNDGYIDNFRGWDMANDDNDPNRASDGGYHGSIVAGISCGRTNNGLGTAGVGFHTKFLPVKIMETSTEILTAGYEGIVYAANHGCDVINCSWGSLYNNKLYAQDIIDYATFNRNALIVAAGGNDDDEDYYYPASLDHVISVSGTTVNDEKWTPDNSSSTSGSNWNIKMDIAAPSADFYAPSKDDSYTRCYGGTSFAAPQVSAAAALVKSAFPSMTAIQLGEQVKVTADDIYNIEYNADYEDLLGYGRVNVYKAVTDNSLPSLYFEHINFSSDSENIIAGDTAEITGYFKNYLSSYNDITIKLESSNAYVDVLYKIFYIESIGADDSVSNADLPFTFIIDEDAPENFTITFKLVFTADNYRSYQYFTLDVSQNTIDITINDINTTVTSDGMLGMVNYSLGKKIQYKDYPDLIYDGGFFYGNDNVLNPEIVSCFRGTTDFSGLSNPALLDDDTFNIHSYTLMNDEDALDRSYGFETSIEIYGIENDTVDYMIHRYLINNVSGNDFEDLYFGIFADADIYNSNYNAVQYDEETGMLFANSMLSNTLYFGMKVLSENKYSQYAIDDYSGNTVYISDGFSELEKQICLTGTRNSAGQSDSDGNEIAMVVSAYEESVLDSDTVDFTVAFLAAETEDALFNAAIEAQRVYDTYIIEKTDTVPNDTIPSSITEMSTPEIYPTVIRNGEELTINSNKEINEIIICDALGRVVFSKNTNKKNYTIPTSCLKKGIYIVELKYINANTDFSRIIVVE